MLSNDTIIWPVYGEIKTVWGRNEQILFQALKTVNTSAKHMKFIK